MRGLDTNVLARYLLRDDERQAQIAKAAIDRALASGEPLVVSLLTLMELEWVLRSRGRFDKAAIIRAIEDLREFRDVAFESEFVVEHALDSFENSNADFADCLMIAQYQRMGCSAMLTFDGDAAKIPGGELLGE